MPTPSQRKLQLECEVLELQKRKIEVETAEHEIHVQGDIARLATREFLFDSPVDERMLGAAESVIDLLIARDASAPITMVLTSPGGGIFAGFGLYDFIRDRIEKGADIRTEVRGCAASMAAVLLQAGTVRSATANSYVMIHEASSVTAGMSSQMRDQVDLLEKIEERTFRLLASRSNVTVKEIEKRTSRKDWWLDADEALEFGFIDQIV